MKWTVENYYKELESAGGRGNVTANVKEVQHISFRRVRSNGVLLKEEYMNGGKKQRERKKGTQNDIDTWGECPNEEMLVKMFPVTTTSEVTHQPPHHKQPPVGSTTSVVDWDVTRVVAWAKDNSLKFDFAVLEAENINGGTLLELEDDDLAELGVTSGLQRKKIRAAIKALA